MGNRSTGCGMVACDPSDYCGAWRAVIDSIALMQSQEITFNDVMEVSMKILPVLVVLTGAGFVAASLPAFAATSPAMKSCSKQWSDMKDANKVPEGEKWSDFWSQCSKNYSANSGEGTAPASTDKPSKLKKTASVSENDSPNSAQLKKGCDAKWDANKTRTGAHGWHDYFQFMSKCM